ncbi:MULTISPECIES: hypothetical protein [Streptomyces]|uniref:hypothetical protein n=1 Tax=Streptomyces TaxID=1883 RepID=UPI00166F9573|nr:MULTISPECIES: hypothetical protein [Streptomyces]UFR06735.1 hypothetical protein KBP30_38640 [Streptomyces sp. Go40/10]GGS54788.1 hypothetical protein GCM10010206_15650 [Streptomyces cinerochromogenes]
MLHTVIAVVGVAPELAGHVRLHPIRAEALVLIALVVLRHTLVRRRMTASS